MRLLHSLPIQKCIDLGGGILCGQAVLLERCARFTGLVKAILNADTDETAQQVQAASAIARQTRGVIIPEIDIYAYSIMTAGAGIKAAKELSTTDTYTDILDASKALGDRRYPNRLRLL